MRKVRLSKAEQKTVNQVKVKELYQDLKNKFPDYSNDRITLEISEISGVIMSTVNKILRNEFSKSLTDKHVRDTRKYNDIRQYYYKLEKEQPKKSVDRLALETAEKFYLSYRTTMAILNYEGPNYGPSLKL